MSVEIYFNKHITLKDIKGKTDIKITFLEDDTNKSMCCFLEKNGDSILATLSGEIDSIDEDSLYILYLTSKGNDISIVSDIISEFQTGFITLERVKQGSEIRKKFLGRYITMRVFEEETES